jgi:hypothetical protein
MVSPSICGGFLTDKHSMVAFTWTITTVLTLIAFLTAIVLMIQINTHYRRMERYYQTDDWLYQNYYTNTDDDNDNDDGEEDKEGGSHDYEDALEQQAAYLLLSTMSARSVSFVAVYTMLLATALSLYGSTAIVGFTSLRGVYIAPCFSSGNSQMRVGMFGGAIVMFANLLLVCAVILGEVRVSDGNIWKFGWFRACVLCFLTLCFLFCFLLPACTSRWRTIKNTSKTVVIVTNRNPIKWNE